MHWARIQFARIGCILMGIAAIVTHFAEQNKNTYYKEVNKTIKKKRYSMTNDSIFKRDKLVNKARSKCG